MLIGIFSILLNFLEIYCRNSFDKYYKGEEIGSIFITFFSINAYSILQYILLLK